MNRISFQWRITLMTAVLIAGACICLNLLLYRSGATGMDNLNGYVLQYQQNDDENLMIEIPDDQMSDFLIQFSQEVYDAKAVFGRKGWCITAAVTLLSAAIAYFVSGKALEPLKKLAQQAERIDQDSLVEVRLEENTIPEFRDLSQSVNRMLDRLAHSFDLQRQFAGNAAHELKTPLTSMKVLADSLNGQEDVPVELYREFMLDIGNEIERENKIINDLLSLVKMDKSASDLNITSVNINEMLDLILKRLKPIAEKLGIEKLLEKYPYEVSGGQKQRAAIARALITKPQLILADEPSGALDSKAADSLMNLFTTINQEGQTIVMVTHSVKAASSAKRVLFIKDGKVFHQLYRGNLTNEEMYERISDTLKILTTGGEEDE